jgi:hypothetical protein
VSQADPKSERLITRTLLGRSISTSSPRFFDWRITAGHPLRQDFGSRLAHRHMSDQPAKLLGRQRAQPGKNPHVEARAPTLLEAALLAAVA